MATQSNAANIMLRHHLLTDFLRTLGIREEAIYHDVEAMEHHISPQTLHAIEDLLSELRKNPALVARIRSRASGSRGGSAESE
jgi:Mn-dependent DtxR family transcriptional regulator